jgi:hypothetical protein
MDSKELKSFKSSDSSVGWYVSKTGIESYSKNPFIKDLVQTVKIGNSTIGVAGASLDVVDRETGEIKNDGAFIGYKKKVDKEEFVKLYANGLASVFELNKSSRDVFLLFLNCLMDTNTSKGKMDVLQMTHHIAKEDYGYPKSQTTFISGINSLAKKGFIARVSNREGMFWINPSFFSKGDRLTLIKQYELDE